MLFSVTVSLHTISVTAKLSSNNIYKALLSPLKKVFAKAIQTQKNMQIINLHLDEFSLTEYTHVASTQIKMEHFQCSRSCLHAPFKSLLTFERLFVLKNFRLIERLQQIVWGSCIPLTIFPDVNI